jgi:hypothetical protein
MTECNQDGITGAFFAHLRGIHNIRTTHLDLENLRNADGYGIKIYISQKLKTAIMAAAAAYHRNV